MQIPSHHTYCLCNGDWDKCCDNQVNYPIELGGYKEPSGPFCDSDEDTDYDMERILTKLSPPPSPHRDDTDWFIVDKQDTTSLRIVSQKKKEITPAIKARKAAIKAREAARKARDVSRLISAKLKIKPMYH